MAPSHWERRAMAQKNENRLDRRRVMALSAAIACSVPAAKAAEGATQVIVDLGGIALPKEIAHVMELDIRRAVLMAVAKARPHTKFKSLPLPPDTLGIILRPA